MSLSDGLDEVFSSVMHSVLDNREPFGVGSPKDDDFVNILLTFKASDVISDLVQLVLFIASNNVICSGFLVFCNEVLLVDTGHGDHVFHIGSEFFDKIIVEDLSPEHGISEVGF